MKLIDDTNNANNYDQNDLTQYFQVKTAKFLSILFISIFSLYHGYLNSFYGKF